MGAAATQINIAARDVVATNAESRKLGDLAGQIWMSEDFDDWPPDLQDSLGMTGPR